MDHHMDLSKMPAAAPPPGQTSNFVNPPSQQGTIIAVCTVMIVLTLFFVTLRLYSSFRVVRAPGAEDYVCIVATIFSFAYLGFVLDLSYVARHMWDVPQIWFTDNYWKIRFAQNTIQAFAFFTSRMPIFLLYLRLFGNNALFRFAVYFGIAAAFAVYMSEIPLISYFCTPRIGGSWNSLEVFAKCKKLLWYAMVQGASNIAMDLYIFLLPLRTIFALQLTPKKKKGVFAIFGVALLAVIASGISLYYRYKLSFTPDVNWNEGAFIATSSVEINIAIICSSIPACASLIKHLNKDGSFFGSLGSLFHRSLFSSKADSKNTKPSYASSYPNGNNPSENSADYSVPLKENGYLELQEGKYNVQAGAMDEANRYNSNNRLGSRQGIKRTIEVDIV